MDEFRQHIHDSTGAAITATVTLVNSLTNDEVLQSGPAERALGCRTATLLAWGGLGSLHYQCSCAMRAHIFQDGGLPRWQQRHMNEGSLSFSQWERELRLAKPDISGEQSHELWTAMVGENLYMDTDIFDRFVLEHLRATHRTFLHRDAAVTSDVLARVEENQTVRVLADNTGVGGRVELVDGSILRTRVSCGEQVGWAAWLFEPFLFHELYSTAVTMLCAVFKMFPSHSV